MNVLIRIKPKTAENSNQEYSSMIISENKNLIFNNKQFCFDYILDEMKHFFDIIDHKIPNDSTVEHAYQVLKLAKGEL